MPDWKTVARRYLEGTVFDEDVLEEVVSHADTLYRALLAEGRSERDSCAAVERELEGVVAVIHAARAHRRHPLPAIPDGGSRGPFQLGAVFVRDVMHGARMLFARPLFASIALITLALGIGANTAVFSVVHAVLLQTLPFPRPEQLVMLWERGASDPQQTFIVAAPNYHDWGRMATSFDGMAIWEYQSFNIAGDGDPEQVSGMRVSASVFPVLGIPPQLGRVFTTAEDVPGHDVLVISDALWRRRFTADPGVLGRTLRLNGRPFEIVGVMPAAFRFTQQRHDVWIPIHFTDQDAARDSHSFFAAARLKSGIGFDSAKAEMESIGRQLAQTYQENHGESATITRMSRFGVGFLRGTLLTLSAAVAIVVLIACVNVANLLLAHASGRRREFAVRAALGAGAARLGSQLLAEGLVLALSGGLAGIFVAWAATTIMANQLPAAIAAAPFREAGIAPLQPQVLAFTFVVAVLTGLIFSIVPALSVIRMNPGGVLKAGGDHGGAGKVTSVRSVLVAAELALSVIVLAAAGLTAKSMVRLLDVDPGLDVSGVLVLETALPQQDFYGPPERTTFCDDILREVGALPGVLSVGATSHLPLSGANATRGFAIDGRPRTSSDQGFGASYRLTCPGYFKTLGIPIVKGRDFTLQDSIGALPVVIINEATAERYWPDVDPLGTRIKLGDDSSDTPWLTIVGVARSVRHFGLDAVPRREMYRPYSQAAWPNMSIVVKSASDPLATAGMVKAALRRLDRDQPVSRVRTMQHVLDESVGTRRFPMLLLSGFAVIALVLAVIGVYGVVSYVVTQRTREIGIRMALGADRGAVVRHVIRRAMLPTTIGLAIGTGGALLASRQLSGLLYDVQPSDPAVLTGIFLLLGSAAIVASWIPAQRAARIDPLITLREG